jgi:hypothetical protein
VVQWAEVDLRERLYASADEAILSKAVAAVENAYENEAGGFSRFPGLSMFTEFRANRVYLSPWRDDLVACTDQGRTFRIARNGSAVDVTGVPINGNNRVVFSQTEDALIMAAGGPIVALSGAQTTLLSAQAPFTTHVAFLEGYLLAIEVLSEQFAYSDPGDYITWNPLSVFAANAKPSAIKAMAVSPYGELMLAKADSVEQYELLPNGVQPFTRRWATGEGIAYPYTMVADKTGTYGINQRFEFIRFYGQISMDQGGDVGLVLEKIDDWTDAWAQELAVKGQKTIILQMPNATNVHGTKGVTLVLDYRARKWSFLYGFDPIASVPVRFPVWSVARQWGHVFAGVPGGVAIFDSDNYELLGGTYPFLARTGHIDKWGPCRIDDVRIRLRRGMGPDGAREPRVGLRVNRDNTGFDQWMFEPMGLQGDRTMTIHWGGQGEADTFQFEIMCTDNVPLELVKFECYVERLRW